jgi:phage-related protein
MAQDCVRLYDSGKVSSFDISTGNFFVQSYDVEQMSERRITNHAIPDKYGSFMQTSKFNGKTISCDVIVTGTTRTLLKNNLRNLKSFLNQENLYFYFDPPGSYIPCEFKSMSSMETKDWKGLKVDMSLQFETDDPFAYYSGDITFTQNWMQTNSINFDVYNSGTAIAYPQITMSGVGSVSIPNIKLTNNTNSSSFEITTNIDAGDSLIVDCTNRTVNMNTNNYISYMNGSDFLSLNCGSNDITATTTASSGTIEYCLELFFPRRDF